MGRCTVNKESPVAARTLPEKRNRSSNNNNAMATNQIGMNNSDSTSAKGEEDAGAHGPEKGSTSVDTQSQQRQQQQSNEVRQTLAPVDDDMDSGRCCCVVNGHGFYRPPWMDKVRWFRDSQWVNANGDAVVF